MPIAPARITHVTKLIDSSNEIVLFDDGFRDVIGYTEDLSERIFNIVASCEIHTLGCDNMSCRLKKRASYSTYIKSKFKIIFYISFT